MCLAKETERLIEIADELSNTFEIGDLISHDHLKAVLGISTLSISDYDSPEDFLKAKECQQIEYLEAIVQLRIDLLERHKIYLKSIAGSGYCFLPPKEQQKFAYRKTRREIGKSLKQGMQISENVRFDSLTNEERQQGNDFSVKLSLLNQMIKTARR